jgi:hypothetical protein
MMSQSDPLVTLYVLPSELPALDAAVVSYINLVQMTLPSSVERAEVIEKLSSFRQRYQGAWGATSVAQTDAHSRPAAHLIPLQATHLELMAFGTAVLGYRRVLEMALPAVERKEVMEHLHRLQQRYLDSLPPAPLHD